MWALRRSSGSCWTCNAFLTSTPSPTADEAGTRTLRKPGIATPAGPATPATPAGPGTAPENTEEMAVTVAASMAQRMMELSLPVGMAVNGENGELLRPDNGPDHLGRMMETLASAQAANMPRMAEFLHSMRPHLNHFHSVTLVTSDTDPSWVQALMELKRFNVTVSIVLVDPTSFGSTWTIENVVSAAAAELVPVYVVGRDAPLDEALARPVNREIIEALDPVSEAAGGLALAGEGHSHAEAGTPEPGTPESGTPGAGSQDAERQETEV